MEVGGKMWMGGVDWTASLSEGRRAMSWKSGSWGYRESLSIAYKYTQTRRSEAHGMMSLSERRLTAVVQPVAGESVSCLRPGCQVRVVVRLDMTISEQHVSQKSDVQQAIDVLRNVLRCRM